MKPASTPTVSSWSGVFDAWDGEPYQEMWRAHSDAVNGGLLERWIPRKAISNALKTDLFDEAVASGLFPILAERAERVTGIDISPTVVEAAKRRYPPLEARVADVRDLPFADGEFDFVFSNSTLDHFESVAELSRGAAELQRVLARGGELLLTLDNRQNPVVAIRTMPQVSGLMRRLRLVPYYVGATCGRRGLVRVLQEANLEVVELAAVMHAPPQVLSRLAAFTARRSGFPQRAAYHRFVLGFEGLARWPSRYFTAHFVAARAVKH